MQKMGKLTFLKVIIMLDKLNNAKELYESATDEETKRNVDKIFADCYDWFTRRDLVIKYDTKKHLWFFVGQESVGDSITGGVLT